MCSREITGPNGLLSLSATGFQILQQGIVVFNGPGGKLVDITTGDILIPTDFAYLGFRTVSSAATVPTTILVTIATESNTQFEFTPVSNDFRGSVNYMVVRSTAPVASVS